MSSVTLTRRAVSKLAAGSSDRLYWDTTLRGFGVRVSRGGAKSFVVQYRPLDGRSRRVTIGGCDTLSLDDGRRRAKEILGQVATGRDPAAEREQARRDAKEAKTIAEVQPIYLDELKARARPSVVYEWTRIWNVELLPELGRSRVRDVTRAQLSQLHVSLQTRRVQANRCLTVAHAFFGWCERHGYRAEGSNPARGISRFRETPRERFLTPEEIGRLGAALDRAERSGLLPAKTMRKEPRSEATAKHRPKSAGQPKRANPFAVAAIRFLALSGWRLREALTLQWEQIEFSRASATLPDSKTGRSVRSLGAPALRLLTELPRVADSRFVFPSPTKSAAPLREIARLWRAVRDAAGLNGVRLHDLRHTAASYGVSAGVSLYEIAALLGHRNCATAARYAHLIDDARKRVADRVSGDIQAALESKVTTITPIDKRTA